MAKLRVRPYAGIRLWPGKPSPYLGLRFSLGLGGRTGRKLAREWANDDHAGSRGPAKRSLSNDA